MKLINLFPSVGSRRGWTPGDVLPRIHRKNKNKPRTYTRPFSELEQHPSFFDDDQRAVLFDGDQTRRRRSSRGGAWWGGHRGRRVREAGDGRREETAPAARTGTGRQRAGLGRAGSRNNNYPGINTARHGGQFAVLVCSGEWMGPQGRRAAAMDGDWRDGSRRGSRRALERRRGGAVRPKGGRRAHQ